MARFAPQHWSQRRMVKTEKLRAPSLDCRSVGVGLTRRSRYKPQPRRAAR